MFPLLNCWVGATVSRLGKFLVGLVPGGDALVEVVEFGADVWERWTKRKPSEAARREELQALAHASPERVGAAVQAAIQAEAAGQPAAVKRKLTTYLAQVQVTVRRTLCRPADPEGRTVPANLHLNSAEDLRPFLPPQLPRFEPGELTSPPVAHRRPAPMPSAPRASGATPIRFACPVCKTAMKAPAQDAGQKLNCPKCGQRIQIPPPPRGTILAESLPPEEKPIQERRRPPRRGVPGWVWLAGSAAAVVVVVVVVLVVRNGSGPKTPDGPPLAAKGAGDADKTKGADKAKDAEPDRKKDKTDTLEKPAPLPRLVAFPKLSLPARGAADLQVQVERQGYAGPIKLQVENLPPGATCQRSATIPAGESSVRIAFRTDGTAAEGTATVEVIATAHTRTADRLKLALLFPPKSVVSVKPPDPLPKSFKNALGIEFVLVPKGKSWLGGGGGKPGSKEVQFKRDFYLGRFEVTQAEWEAVMGSNPSHFSRTGGGKDAVQGTPDEELKRFPVENVSYEDAKAFVVELNKRCKEEGWVYRLPTEAEWEYAARGGPMKDRQESTFDWYFEFPTNELKRGQANFDLERPTKVGSYRPNRLGLHDMHGNVWEWCDDALADLPGLQPIGKDAAPGIVERGGCWHDGPEYRPLSARISFPPSYRHNDHGFRVARVPVGADRK